MINQVRFADAVKVFESRFCQRWDVKEYHDPQAACFFAGVYSQKDVDVINSHRGFKIVWNTGRVRDCFYQISPASIILRGIRMVDHLDTLPQGYRVKFANFESQDYAMFRSNPLGDKVYWYLGDETQKESYGFSIMKKVQDLIPFEIIPGIQGHTLEHVKKYYYDKCFVNVKINDIGGFTTATELACMGRYTIAKAKGSVPFYLPFWDVKDIVNLIRIESEKIGTIQSSLIGNFFDVGKEWQDENFWI